MGRGFIRKSRKVGFGAIAGPAAGDVIVDENEDENDLDELDAFADTTDEVDVAEMGLKVKPVPPVTPWNSADAEDLRAFLEAERRRKHLYGSDVEAKEEVAVQKHWQDSEDMEHEIVDLVSEDELNNWDADESSVVIIKQKNSNIPSLISNFRMPDVPQAELGTPRRSPRKRNRVSSDSDDLPRLSPTVYKTPDDKAVKHKSPRQSSSRSQKPRPSPELSVSSDIGDDSGIPSSTSYLRSPSIPQAKSKTLRRSPRKRNCVSSDPDDLPCLSPTFSKISDNNVVKQSSSRSQVPRLSPELGVSSDIIQDNRRILSSTSNLRMSSIPRAKSETLRRSPRKRNRVSFDPDDLPCLNQPPTVYKKITDIDYNFVGRKSPRRSSSRSQGPQLSPNLSVSIHKQDDSGIASGSSTSLRTPSIPQAKCETSRKSPRKRNRVSFDSDDLTGLEQPPTVYKIPDDGVAKHKSLSSQSQRPRPSPKLSVSCSESEIGYSSNSEQEYNHEPSRSHYDNFQFPYHYPYPQHHRFYPSSPQRNQQQQEQEQHHPSPEMFMPPIPDPRAQLIITQAMHRLSALVSTPWMSTHDPSFIPHTPSRRDQSRRANSVFNTPYHPHPYPYSYDPNLSIPTLPPESSPEPTSSPEKLLAKASSRSRKRKVSFKIDGSSVSSRTSMIIRSKSESDILAEASSRKS